MAQYNISVVGTIIGVVDSAGQNQPFSSAHKPYPASQSVSPMGAGSGSGAGRPGKGSDVSVRDSTTQAVIADRA